MIEELYRCDWCNKIIKKRQALDMIYITNHQSWIDAAFGSAVMSGELCPKCAEKVLKLQKSCKNR